jgi:hypothetical protein
MTSAVENINLFHQNGIIVIENLFSMEFIDQIRIETLKSYDEVFEILNQKNLELGIGAQNGYKE